MKNTVALLLAAFLVMTGCVKEELEDCSGTFTCNVEDMSLTRTYLNADNKILWDKNDVIAVFEGNSNASTYKVNSYSAGKPSADFTKTANSAAGTAIGANVALYPYSESLKCSALSNGSFKISGFNLPSVQNYDSDGFGAGMFPMAAVSPIGDNNLAFKNICGVLKLQLKGSAEIKRIIVKGNGGEMLSGPAEITVSSNGSPEVKMLSGASGEVALDCGSAGVQLSKDNPSSFWIVLPPVEFSKGFSITVIDTRDRKMELSTSKANPVRRSSVLRMPEKVYEPQSTGTSIQAVSLTFNEAIIKVTVCNAVQYSGGYKLKSEFDLSKLPREANWKTAPRITDSFEYEGPLTAFPKGGDAAPVSSGQTYVVWLAPYAEGQKLVTEEDIIYKEFTIPDLKSGGTSEVTVKSSSATFKSVEAHVSSSGAAVLYAAFVTSSEKASLTTDAKKVSYLMSNATPITGGSGSVMRSGLNPGTSLTLMAIAVDKNGKYGKVLQTSFSTSTPTFNDDISIRMSVDYKGRTANVKVDASGASVYRFLYFYDKTSSSSWKKTLGGTRESAEEFMVLNEDNYLINNTDDRPFVNGKIVIENVEVGEEYVVVVMAQTVDGTLSRAQLIKFIPVLDLGDFVFNTGSDKTKWNATRPSVTFGNCSNTGEFYTINWAVTPGQGTTAYAVCAHPNSMEDCNTPEDLAIRIYNLGVEVVSGRMETTLYGDKENLVYVTWRDKDGNFYEAYSVAVPQD